MTRPAARVGSGDVNKKRVKSIEVFEISRVLSGRVMRFSNITGRAGLTQP